MTAPREPGTDPASQVPFLDRSVRSWMLDRFGDWLDEAFGDERAPEGLPAEVLAQMRADDAPDSSGDALAAPDLLSLWSSLTQVAQEVRIQGRSLKDLTGSVAKLPELAEHVEAASTAQARALAEATERARTVEERVQTDLLEVLLDVRDRLHRGLASVRRPQARASTSRLPRWLAWLAPAAGAEMRRNTEAVEALENGYRMGMERLDETLTKLGVQQMDCRGKAFDPRQMCAVEAVAVGDGDQEGQVLEVVRPGYLRAGEVLRMAQVTVGRRLTVNKTGG